MHLLRQIFDRYVWLKHTMIALEQTFECRNLLKISICIYLVLSDLLKPEYGRRDKAQKYWVTCQAEGANTQ